MRAIATKKALGAMPRAQSESRVCKETLKNIKIII